MKNLKRKNYYLDEKKIRRVRAILGASTETEAIDRALNLVVFRREILKSLEKVAGKGGVEKIFWWRNIWSIPTSTSISSKAEELSPLSVSYTIKRRAWHLLQLDRRSRTAGRCSHCCRKTKRPDIIHAIRTSRQNCDSRSQGVEGHRSNTGQGPAPPARPQGQASRFSQRLLVGVECTVDRGDALHQESRRFHLASECTFLLTGGD